MASQTSLLLPRYNRRCSGLRRIEIAQAAPAPTLSRPLMTDHNLSARVWATAALVAVPIASRTGVGWWLPLHLALLGAVTQAIVGGQLMFSTTLGLSRGPSRRLTLTQLGLLNVAALSVITGRLIDHLGVFIAGVSILVGVIGWVTWQVHLMWRRSVNRRFALTGMFYRLAGTSLLLGASIGGALGIGAFDNGGSYIAHRTVHMILNVYGWAGMTIVGTAVTLLPTILHARAPKLERVRAAPWLMFLGLMVMSGGATTEAGVVGGAGMGIYLIGFGTFALYIKQVLLTPSRRKIPTAAFHLIAAVTWALASTVALMLTLWRGDWTAVRDFAVVGGAAGFVFQALMGAWLFLLPSTRAPVPERRRVELIAMELGGRAQVVAYNAGLVLVLVGLRSGWELSLVGIWLAWIAASWALVKAWTFPALSRLTHVQRRAAAWWAEPVGGGI